MWENPPPPPLQIRQQHVQIVFTVTFVFLCETNTSHIVFQRYFPWTQLSLKSHAEMVKNWKYSVLWSSWSQLCMLYSCVSPFCNKVNTISLFSILTCSEIGFNRTLKRLYKAFSESEGSSMAQNKKLNYWLAELQNMLINVLCVSKMWTQKDRVFFLDKGRLQFSIA